MKLKLQKYCKRHILVLFIYLFILFFVAGGGGEGLVRMMFGLVHHSVSACPKSKKNWFSLHPVNSPDQNYCFKNKAGAK